MSAPISFPAATVLLLVASLSTSAALRIRGRAPFLLAMLVAAAASIVLAVIVLSTLGLVTRPGLLIAQAIFCAAAIVAWAASGRPHPPGPWRWPRASTLVGFARLRPALALLLSAAAVALTLQLVMAVAVTPNNWDSMTYHLSRAAYWLQQASAEHFPGGSLRQLASPPNAEMLQLWSMGLSGGDRYVQLPQWLALMGLGVAVFSAARVLGSSAANAAFAAAIFVLLPQPLMQSASAQNDLVAAFFVAATALFGVRGLRDRSFGDLAIAAAALGLAVGTKGTALFAGPSLLVLLAGAAIGYRPPLRVLAAAAAFALVGIVALGSFGYALNLAASGDPFGGLGGAVERTAPMRENLVQVGLTLLDSPGMPIPWLDLVLSQALSAVGVLPAGATTILRTTVQEDTSAFGLVGLMLLVPAVLVGLLGPRVPAGARVLALAALAYVAVFVVAVQHNPWIGRVLIPSAALAAPLLALLASSSVVRAVGAFTAVLALLPCLLVNPQKPLLTAPGGSPFIFGLDRPTQQTLIRPEMREVLYALQVRVPPDQPLGFVGGEDSWDYPLFGAGLDRRVVRLRMEDVTEGLMRREQLAGVLVANVGKPPAPLRAEQLGPDYFLIRRRDERGD